MKQRDNGNASSPASTIPTVEADTVRACATTIAECRASNEVRRLVSSLVVLGALQLPGISCPFLTAPEHGHITYSQGNKFGSRATYECDAGYLLEGAKYRHCQGDMWWGPSDTIPYCAKEGKTMSSENGCDQTGQSKFIRSQDDRGDLLILHVLSRWFGSIRFLSWYIHIH